MGTWLEVAQLESRMNTEDYRKLQSLFLDSSGCPRSLSRAEFVDLARLSVGNGSEEDYGLLFDGVVITQDNGSLLLNANGEEDERCIDWRGLCSFLLMELSDKVKNSRSIDVPCWKPPRTLTCPHWDPIQKMLYLQNSDQYLTVSKSGTVGLRDREDLSIVRTHQLRNSTVTPKNLWVTDLVLLPNVLKIAASFSSKEVLFYDVLSEPAFSCKYKLLGLKFTPWCLDYWESGSHPDQAVLAIGDTGGQVSALCFTAVQISLFGRVGPKTKSDSAVVIQWDDLVKGKHHFCYIVAHKTHGPAWVRKVRYLGSLEALVSCSTGPLSSVVIAWSEQGMRSLRVTSFSTKMGVWDMDYHCRLNLIGSAGVDHQVLLWNPYVTSCPVCVLNGHTSPVTAVRFLQAKDQLLSYSKDKILCLWDVTQQLCVHRLAGVFPRMQEDLQTVLFLNEEHQQVLLSFNSLLVLLETDKDKIKTDSHEHPVTCVLFNSLFRQVVTSDSASCVIYWSADTGRKVKQFHRCHGNARISTIALDAMQTRLFTAATDGEVKVWNFHGRCLHRMNAGLVEGISQVLLLEKSILVMGWERTLTVFRLHSFSQPLVEPSEWKGGIQHSGDVLCAAFQPPQTLATGSSDGEIIVWNSSTEKPLRKLRPHAERNGHVQQQGLDGKEDLDSCTAITRLFFIPGRTSVIETTGGADLVSCGGLGVVRLWSTQRSCQVGGFTAHSGDLGSIVMTISPCGKYLATADGRGTIKTWDIEFYCLNPEEKLSRVPPKQLQSFHPHLDRVTHLETFLHGDRIFLLSSSSDCSAALSLLLEGAVGLFGQEDQWRLGRPGQLRPREELAGAQKDGGQEKARPQCC